MVESICERLDGIPLAVELAAARVRMLTPERILAGLDDRFQLLPEGRPPSLASRRCGRRLSGATTCQRAGADTPAPTLGVRRRVHPRRGRAVVRRGRARSLEVLDLLGRLVDRSLVVADDDRYRMLERSVTSPPAVWPARARTTTVRARHLAFYVELAEVAGAEIERSADLMWLACLEDEHDNLRAALAWALAGNDPVRAAQLAIALTPFWTGHGHYWEAQTWLRRAADELRPGSDPGARAVVPRPCAAAGDARRERLRLHQQRSGGCAGAGRRRRGDGR